jgi:membrane protein
VLRGLGWGLATAHIVDLLRWPVLLVVVGLLSRRSIASDRAGLTRTGAVSLLEAVSPSLLWVCGSLLFSFVVSQLGRFDELYGSVGAMIGFMLWIWLSITVVLVGAELDSTAWRTAKEPDIAPQPPPSG